MTTKLYGVHCSLYTGKVRSYLRKNAIPFAERTQSHPHYRDTVLPAVKNHRIPVVEFDDGTMVQDSTAILDACESRFPQVAKPKGALRVVERFIEAYAERSLLKAAMHYRWNFPEENRAFIVGEFGRIIAFANGPDAWPQVGEAIAGRMSAYLPPLGITADSIPAIEASYLKLLALLNAHFALYPYILGDAPSRADYGLMGKRARNRSTRVPGSPPRLLRCRERPADVPRHPEASRRRIRGRGRDNGASLREMGRRARGQSVRRSRLRQG